ncbi:MAG: GNAT family N-acetyltransferase [Victivallales bacterium]
MSRIIDISRSRDNFLPELLTVWEDSVRSSHEFLSEQDIENLKPMVLSALRAVPQLFCLFREKDHGVIGFMGVDGGMLEMLFLASAWRGRGYGKKMICYAIGKLKISRVDVNEQNHQARKFYERAGFSVYARSELDGQGNPFPVLHMKLQM